MREVATPARGGGPPPPVASVNLLSDEDEGSAGVSAAAAAAARSIVSRRDADGGVPAARGRSSVVVVVVVVVVVDGDGDGDPSTDRSGDPPVIALRSYPPRPVLAVPASSSAGGPRARLLPPLLERGCVLGRDSGWQCDVAAELLLPLEREMIQ